MKVFVVSKTKMKNNMCVGGILHNGRSVRLLDSHGANQPLDTDFQIGGFYEIEYSEREKKYRPHLEDILLKNYRYVGMARSPRALALHYVKNRNVHICNGSPDRLFQSRIKWTASGSGYISMEGYVPDFSTMFWVPDRDLTCVDSRGTGTVRYQYPDSSNRRLPYVGSQPAVNTIPANTLLRVSLARWWSKNDTVEKRCYMQLSGWLT